MRACATVLLLSHAVESKDERAPATQAVVEQAPDLYTSTAQAKEDQAGWLYEQMLMEFASPSAWLTACQGCSDETTCSDEKLQNTHRNTHSCPNHLPHRGLGPGADLFCICRCLLWRVHRAIGRLITAYCSTKNHTNTSTTRKHDAAKLLQDLLSVQGETSHSSPPSPAPSSHWQACTPITRAAPCMHNSSDPNQPQQQTCCCGSRSCPEAGTSSTCGAKPAGEGVQLHPQHSESSSHPGRGGRCGEWCTTATPHAPRHVTLPSYIHTTVPPCKHIIHDSTKTRCLWHVACTCRCSATSTPPWPPAVPVALVGSLHPPPAAMAVVVATLAAAGATLVATRAPIPAATQHTGVLAATSLACNLHR